jgi:hypothetical protein
MEDYLFIRSEYQLYYSRDYSVTPKIAGGMPSIIDATAKSPKNSAKTTTTLQNQVGKKLLTLASN